MNIHGTTSANSTQTDSLNNMIVNILGYNKPMNTEQVDVLQLGKQLRFDLTIPTADEELPRKQLRMKRKSFAIACQTDMSSKIYFYK